MTIYICLMTAPLLAFQLPEIGQSIISKELPETNTLYESAQIWRLGNGHNIDHVFFIYHGDTPSFYTDEIKDDMKRVHQVLKNKNSGALIVQFKSLSAKEMKVPGGQGWGDIYGKSLGGQKNDALRFLYSKSIISTFNIIKELFYYNKLKLHLVTFSGSGRIDRAFHEYIELHKSDARIQKLMNEELISTTAIDAFVHWSFIDYQEKPLVRSWNNFLKSYPHIKTTLVYDQKRTYPYMADMIADILSSHRLQETKLPMRATRYNQLTIYPANGHKEAFTKGLAKYLVMQL